MIGRLALFAAATIVLLLVIAGLVWSQRAPRQSRFDLLDPGHEMRWYGPDPGDLDGRYQRDPRLGGAS